MNNTLDCRAQSARSFPGGTADAAAPNLTASTSGGFFNSRRNNNNNNNNTNNNVVVDGTSSSSNNNTNRRSISERTPNNIFSFRNRRNQNNNNNNVGGEAVVADNNPSSTLSLRDSVRNSITNVKTMTFLRNFLGQREHEYVSDTVVQTRSAGNVHAPHHHHHHRGMVVASASSSSSSPQQQLHEDEQQQRRRRQQGHARRAPNTAAVSALRAEHRKRYINQHVLNSRMWKIVLIFFTLILLFGAQIRDLFIPQAGDPAVDAVFIVAFLFFLVDILLRMDAERNYFHLYLCGCIRYSSGVAKDATSSTDYYHHGNNNNNTNPSKFGDGATTGSSLKCCGRPFQVGSFLFACDLVSTITLLREISFIMKRNFDEQYVDIELDRWGMPADVSLCIVMSKQHAIFHVLTCFPSLDTPFFINKYRLKDRSMSTTLLQ